MIIDTILERLPEMSPANKKIANYFLDNKEEIGFLSIHRLSEEIGVSIASIVRFAKNLSFSGFNELKKSIQDEIRKTLSSYEKAISTSLDILPKEQQLERFIDNELNNLKKTLESIDKETIFQMVRQIHQSDKIFLCGFGATRFVMHKLEYSLQSLTSKTVHAITGSISDFVIKLKSVEKDSLVIIFTFPEYSKEIFFVRDYVKQKGATLFLFTDSVLCPIYRDADKVQLCENYSLLSNNSFVGVVAITQVLTNMMMLDRKEESIQNVQVSMEMETEGYMKLTNRKQK
ncbi:MurR/RpiR family transcriptional regulator [bacterium]|nr:MurR/RpiR family transcriptional regulator [bacterium]